MSDTPRTPSQYELAATMQKEGEDRLAAVTKKYEDKIAKLEKELKELGETNTLNWESADAACHVIIENTDFPAGASCKCDYCKSVATAMDESGFAEGVKETWWK